MRPAPHEYTSFYGKYVEAIEEANTLMALERSLAEALEFLPGIPGKKSDYSYAAGKWTVKEMLQHIIDTERIMAYRALCFARGEQAAQPGYDQDDYVAALDLRNRNLSDLQEELLELKKSTITLFRSFQEEAFLRMGNMNSSITSVRAIGYIIAGHQKHHFGILKERYF